MSCFWWRIVVFLCSMPLLCCKYLVVVASSPEYDKFAPCCWWYTSILHDATPTPLDANMSSLMPLRSVAASIVCRRMCNGAVAFAVCCCGQFPILCINAVIPCGHYCCLVFHYVSDAVFVLQYCVLIFVLLASFVKVANAVLLMLLLPRRQCGALVSCHRSKSLLLLLLCRQFQL